MWLYILASLVAFIALMSWLTNWQYKQTDKLNSSAMRFSGVIGTMTENHSRHQPISEIISSEFEYVLSIVTSQGIHFLKFYLFKTNLHRFMYI